MGKAKTLEELSAGDKGKFTMMRKALQTHVFWTLILTPLYFTIFPKEAFIHFFGDHVSIITTIVVVTNWMTAGGIYILGGVKMQA